MTHKYSNAIKEKRPLPQTTNSGHEDDLYKLYNDVVKLLSKKKLQVGRENRDENARKKKRCVLIYVVYIESHKVQHKKAPLILIKCKFGNMTCKLCTNDGLSHDLLIESP